MNIRKLPFFMIPVFELERPYIQMSFTERVKSTPLKPGDNMIYFLSKWSVRDVMWGGNVKIRIITVVKICIYYRVGRKTSDFGPVPYG